jgi:glycolate oxidase iron-sulfur subunit
MQTALADFIRHTPEGTEADAILRKCVHCGFCTATCPTYQLLGDELDGPRGRIYLMKQVLEGREVTRATQVHLDRCLTCRNCETTCPSGVQYGRLVDIGRKIVDDHVVRPAAERLARTALKEGLTSAAFGPAMAVGKLVRPLLPAGLKAKVPGPQPAGAWPARTHERKALLLEGCVQPAMAPNINTATARVLDAVGVETLRPKAAGWPYVKDAEAEGIVAIVVNASGCGLQVREYAHLLARDPAYARKAERISALAKDPAELLPAYADALKRALPAPVGGRVVFHSPCTLQHGLKVRGAVEALLASLGAQVQPAAEAHFCCGSAGTYSVLQSELAIRLRDRRLGHLQAPKPDVILSANIGCITHLASGTTTRVLHWIEWLDERLAAAR